MEDLKSAQAMDVGAMELAQSYNMLCLHPEQQARAIAEHYLAHQAVASTLLRLIERDGYEGHTGESSIDKAIAYLVQIIKQNHRKDFGIELEWPSEYKEDVRRIVREELDIIRQPKFGMKAP